MNNDPAQQAAVPEQSAPRAPIYAVGIGPGDPGYLTPRGQDAIATADVVVGFETVVDHIKGHVNGDLLACGYDDQSETLKGFGTRVSNGASGTAVLMGDPNISGYQFLGRLEHAVDRPIRVIPGISSVQIAASRARTPLENTCLVSLHKRGSLDPDLERLRTAPPERHLIVLPRPYDWMPGDIAAHLLDAGAAGTREALVFEHLTQESEQRTTETLTDLAKSAGGSEPEEAAFSDLSVLVIRGQP